MISIAIVVRTGIHGEKWLLCPIQRVGRLAIRTKSEGKFVGGVLAIFPLFLGPPQSNIHSTNSTLDLHSTLYTALDTGHWIAGFSIMGWFWGSKDDPVENLDLGLREYLEHEAPKYAPPPRVPSQDAPKTDSQGQSQSQTSSQPVPNASLFPDGRYAHLWKTYTPPQEENVETKGAERVIGKEKERKDTVQRAAMENCALEHEALTYCFQTGNWQKQLKARVTLCSEENSTFSRCFTTQAVRPFPSRIYIYIYILRTR